MSWGPLQCNPLVFQVFLLFSRSAQDWYWSQHVCRFVFGVTAFFPLITSGVAGLVVEEPWSPCSRRISLLHPAESADPDETRGLISFLKTSKMQLDSLWETIKEPNILMSTIFLFLFQATPTSEKVMSPMGTKVFFLLCDFPQHSWATILDYKEKAHFNISSLHCYSIVRVCYLWFYWGCVN
jgi:hypothetical protein